MRKSLIVLIVLFASFAAYSQDLVPDFINQPMLLSGGKLLPLEKQTPELKNHGGYSGGYGAYGGGYAGPSSQTLHLDGKHSDVRTTQKPEFMIKVNVDIDPETLFYLTVVTQKKAGREVEMSKQGAFGSAGKSVKRFHVKLEYEKVSPGIYKIRPAEVLETGEEYSFVRVGQGATTGGSTIYSFGVGALDK